MYHLIKKNQKKLLAVFAVLLMISFVATFSIGRAGSGGGGTDAIVAYLGKTPVYDSQMRAAQNDWNWARQTQVRSQPFQREPVAIDVILFASSGIPRPPMPSFDKDGLQQWQQRAKNWDEHFGQQFQDAQSIAGSFFQTAEEHNEVFFLLSQEARQDGLGVDPDGDEVNAYLYNVLGVQPSELPQGSVARTSIQRLMEIAAEIRRLRNAIKVSQPLWQHEAADRQSVRLDLIDFRAGDFAKNVPAPTTQQVAQQFDRFKDVPPHQPNANNPLGFGYQIPARVKLQYMEIPRSEVIEAVIHTVRPTGVDSSLTSADSQYDWVVQAASYYNDHPEEFKAPPQTQPTTQSTQPTTAAASSPTEPSTGPSLAASEPTTKPFDEVKQQIIEKLAAPQAETLTKQIVDDLSARLASDYQVVRQADPAAVTPASSQPATTQPVASMAATRATTDLMMFARLEQIRTQIQEKYHVAIQLHDIESDWQTQTELATLPGIGSATDAVGTAFPELVTSFAHRESLTKQPPIQIWQPSPALKDGQQNNYLFRLTAAQLPHAPPDLAPIAKQVEADWKLSQSYFQATQAAENALASAKSVGLSQAARTADERVISTSLFSPMPLNEIPGYPLPDASAEQAVAKAAVDLLSKATPSDKHPDILVPLPSAFRVAVIELAAAQLPAPEWLMELSLIRQQQMEPIDRLAMDWFDYNLIVARTGYKPEQKS